MSDINVSVLCGRLADNAKSSKLPSGLTKAEFTVCSNTYTKDSNYANFFYLTIFGQRAESLLPYLVKGKSVEIKGHLRQDRWEKDGKKYQKLGIVVDDIQLAGGTNNSKEEAVAPVSPEPIDETFDFPIY